MGSSRWSTSMATQGQKLSTLQLACWMGWEDKKIIKDLSIAVLVAQSCKPTKKRMRKFNFSNLVFNKKGMQRCEGSWNSPCYTSSTFALLSLLSFLIAGRSPSTFGRHRATCAASRTGCYTRRQWNWSAFAHKGQKLIRGMVNSFGKHPHDSVCIYIYIQICILTYTVLYKLLFS